MPWAYEWVLIFALWNYFHGLFLKMICWLFFVSSEIIEINPKCWSLEKSVNAIAYIIYVYMLYHFFSFQNSLTRVSWKYTTRDITTVRVDLHQHTCKLFKQCGKNHLKINAIYFSLKRLETKWTSWIHVLQAIWEAQNKEDYTLLSDDKLSNWWIRDKSFFKFLSAL